MGDKDEMDQLLDSALGTYADPGPDAGLEGRVLAAMAAESALVGNRSAGWRWMGWAIAVPAVASLVVWVAIHRGPQAPPVGQRGEIRASAPNAPAAATLIDPHQKENLAGAKARRGVDLESARLMARPVAKPLLGKVFSQPLEACPVTERDAPARGGPEFIPCPAAHMGLQLAAAPSLPKRDVFPSPQPLTAEEQVLVAAARSGSKAEREALLAAQTPSDKPLDVAALSIPPLSGSDEGKN